MTKLAGPRGYENWKALLAGAPIRSRFEVELFSDRKFRGELGGIEHAPFQLFNLVTSRPEHQLLPRLVLRVSEYLEPRSHFDVKTDTSAYHGGVIEDEVAALWSLALGVKLAAGNRTREWGWTDDPLGKPTAYGDRDEPYAPPPRRQKPESGQEAPLLDHHWEVFARYPKVPPTAAIALVRAARSYQQALAIGSSDPNLRWLLLVSAAETAATAWQLGRRPDAEADFLEAHGDLVTKLQQEKLELAVPLVAKHFHGITKATARFVDFMMTFLPAPPMPRPSRGALSWEPDVMRAILKKVYGLRSSALHSGIPFPAPMAWEPSYSEGEVPGGLAAHTLDGSWVPEDMPVHAHVFAHIVRGALLKWWQSLATDGEERAV